MNIFSYDPATVLSLILTIMRVSIVMFMLPIFSTNNIPISVKAAISVIFTLGVWPHISVSGAIMPQFMGIQSGGELLGFQMGFTMINFADPLTGNQTGATAFFIWMVSALTFLVLDGHLYMIQGFVASFRIVPPGGLVVGDVVLDQVIRLSAEVFVLALKIAAPVMVALFLVEVALGMMARTSPQIHIMEFGFPIKIAVGFFFLGLLLYIMAEHISTFIRGMDGLFINLMRMMSPAR